MDDISRLTTALETSRQRNHTHKIGEQAEMLARAQIAAGNSTAAVPLLAEAITADPTSPATRRRFRLLLAIAPDAPQVFNSLKEVVRKAPLRVMSDMIDAFAWDQIAARRHIQLISHLDELEAVELHSTPRIYARVDAIRRALTHVINRASREAMFSEQTVMAYSDLVPTMARSTTDLMMISGLMGITRRLLNIAEASGLDGPKQSVLMSLGVTLATPANLGLMRSSKNTLVDHALFTHWGSEDLAPLLADVAAAYGRSGLWHAAAQLIETVALNPMPYLTSNTPMDFMETLAVRTFQLAETARAAGVPPAGDRLFRAGVVAMTRGPAPRDSKAARALADHLLRRTSDDAELQSLIDTVEKYSELGRPLAVDVVFGTMPPNGTEFLQYLNGEPEDDLTPLQALRRYGHFRIGAPKSSWTDLVPPSIWTEEFDALALESDMESLKPEDQLIGDVASAFGKKHNRLGSRRLEGRARQLHERGLHEAATNIELDVFRTELTYSFFIHDTTRLAQTIHTVRLGESLINNGVSLEDVLQPLNDEVAVRSAKGISTKWLEDFADELRARALIRDVMSTDDSSTVLHIHATPLYPAGNNFILAATRLEGLGKIMRSDLMELLVESLPDEHARTLAEACTTAALRTARRLHDDVPLEKTDVEAAAYACYEAVTAIAERDVFLAADAVTAFRTGTGPAFDLVLVPMARDLLDDLEAGYVARLDDSSGHNAPSTHVGIPAAIAMLDLAKLALNSVEQRSLLSRIDGAPLGRVRLALMSELLSDPGSARSIVAQWATLCTDDPGDMRPLASAEYILEQVRHSPRATEAVRNAITALETTHPVLHNRGTSIELGTPDLSH